MKLEVAGIEGSPERDIPIIESLLDILEADASIAAGIAIANYLVPGSEVSDCDLLLALEFDGPLQVSPFEKVNCAFRNLIFLVELKRCVYCELRGGSLYVQYEQGARWKNATKQAYDVAANLGWYLGGQGKRYNLEKTWVYGGLYLSNIPADPVLAHPVVEESTIFKGTFSVRTLVTLAARQRARRAEQAQHRHGAALWLSSWTGANRKEEDEQFVALRQTLGFFREARRPAAHDRRRIEVFTKKRIARDSEYLRKLGSQLLIFKGQAGTGKTARLLGLARHLMKYGSSCMLVTYNQALALDIRRLVAVMSDLGESLDLPVRTIGQILFRMSSAMGNETFRKDLKRAYDENYMKGFAMALASVEAMLEPDERKEMRELALSELPVLDVDYILIDEGQDWHPTEIALIEWLAGDPRRLVVAVGPDQNTRNRGNLLEGTRRTARRRKAGWQPSRRRAHLRAQLSSQGGRPPRNRSAPRSTALGRHGPGCPQYHPDARPGRVSPALLRVRPRTGVVGGDSATD